jgi:hypothetical protein
MKKFAGTILGIALAVGLPATAMATSAAALQPPGRAQPDDAAKLAEARAIVQIISPPAEREKSLSTMLPKVAEQFRPKLPPEVTADPSLEAILDGASKDFMEQARPVLLKHLPDMVEAHAIAYTHEFSLAELKDIHAFAETPAGHHYLSRSAFLIADPAVAKANSAMIAEIQQLAEAQKAGLKDKLIAYFKAHPDLAKKLGASEQGK